MSLTNIGWRTKLLTLFTIVLTASLLIQVFYIVPYIQDRELQRASTRHEELAHAITRDEEAGLSHFESMLLTMADQPVFRNMDIDNQTETMMDYMDLHPEINSLSALNSTGWFVTGTMANFSTIYTTHSYSASTFFSVPFLQGVTSFGAPFSHVEGQVGMSIRVPIRSFIGEIVGVLIGSLTINGVIDTLFEYPFDTGTIAYLVDQRGIVLAHSEIDIFNLDDGPLSLNYSSNHLVEDAINGSANVIDVHDINGTSVLGMAIALESVDWIMILEAPVSMIMAEGNVLTTNMLVLNLLVFGVGLVITLVFAQQIVTQQEQKTIELKNAQEQLIIQERMATLGKISGGVGHELRNPLSSIKTAAYLLRMVLKNPETDVAEALDIIEKEVDISTRIIESLMDFARPRPTLLEKVVINQVIETALSRIDVPTNVDVVTELDDEIPIILADRVQIIQAIRNISLNGIQAMPDGGRLTIKSERSEENTVVISITDTGVGIQKENIDRLFEFLFTTKAKGIGLGLAITKSIIERHQGTIDVESREGEGSTFRITLPLYEKLESM